MQTARARRVGVALLGALLVLPAPAAFGADLVPTTIELDVPETVGLGEPLPITASVAPDPGGGWLNISIDGTPRLTTQVPPGGVVEWTYEPGLAYYGEHVVQALFSSTATHGGSHAEAFIQVPDDRIPVTVSLTSSPNPGLRGDPVSFEVGVSPNPRGGEVELILGASRLDVGALAGNGTATLEATFDSFGTFPVKACFIGNDTHRQACSEPVQQVVEGIDSTTTLTIDPGTAYPHESVTFAVTVRPAPEGGAMVAVGTQPGDERIRVYVDAASGYGEVTLPPSELYRFALGTVYELEAYFAGAGRLEPSVSEAVPFLVRYDEPDLVIDVDAHGRHVGDEITFSASVTPLPVVESAGVGFFVHGPATTGFGDHVAVMLGLDGEGQTVVDTDGWPAGEYWWEAGCCGDPRLAPTTVRGSFTLIDVDAPAGSISVEDGLPIVAGRVVQADIPASDGVGSGVEVVALSNDGSTWTTMPYSDAVDWALPAGDGTRTVRAKWRDQAGNWSAVASDSVIVDTTPPAGTVSIAGGAATTKTTAVTVSTAATDAGSGVSQVALSNDGTTWTTRTYASSQAWTLTSGNGTKTVRVKWKDAAANWSAVQSDTIVLDTVAPTIGSVKFGMVRGGLVTDDKVRVRVSWTASDATSGIARYELARSVDGGGYTKVSDTLTGTSHDLWLPTQYTYRFRVRAWDKAGNLSTFLVGPESRLSRYSETNSAITYRGTWSTARGSSLWGGAAKRSSQAGATARFTVTARQIAWVTRMGPNRGKAEIWQGSTRLATVDLYSATYKDRVVVWVGGWSTTASRTITVKVLGTSGRPYVDIDAFLRLR